ncbi:MAG: hypothetical protein CMK09_18725 [Ponticaulis sp.]|nr:hypothetical protein [Ponticaulis sp.]|tara:strand:+ start:119543 stop:120025 length:483 start_codon:yes stop_codon:yes gene_type:complete
MSKITTFLWFDNFEGRNAAEFYTSLLPDSYIEGGDKAPVDNPSSEKGKELVVNFTLAGQKYAALNGGPHFRPTEAVSFMILCEDQAEIDRLWNAITANGGEESMCGWCKDRWGFSWQITPKYHMDLMASDDAAAKERAFAAMMKMKKFDIAAIKAAVGQA